MSSLPPATVMRLWFEEVWNGRRADRIATYLAPDALMHGLDGTGEPAPGPDAFARFHARFLAAFPDIRFTLHEVIEQGDRAAARWTVHATHEGEGLGIAPTGERVALEGMSMIRVRDGQAAEVWNVYDQMRLAMACRLVVPAA
jgi:predicted ester cyclase